MPIALVLTVCSVLGVLLAQSFLPVRAGFLGAAILVFAASRLRGRWQDDQSAPDAAERASLLSIAGTLVCLGYFLAMLYQIGPGLDIHAPATRKMANELWILVAASFAAQWIVQAPHATHDELDSTIAARALSVSCYLLLSLQATLVVWFALLLDKGSALRSIDMLVHLVIGCWMVAHIFYGLFCVNAYAALRAAGRNAA